MGLLLNHLYFTNHDILCEFFEGNVITSKGTEVQGDQTV
jgi:hypothetical protein